MTLPNYANGIINGVINQVETAVAGALASGTGVNGVINQVEAVVAGSHPSSGDPGPTSAATDTAAAAAVHTDATVAATGANDVVTHAAGTTAIDGLADALGHDIGGPIGWLVSAVGKQADFLAGNNLPADAVSHATEVLNSADGAAGVHAAMGAAGAVVDALGGALASGGDVNGVINGVINQVETAVSGALASGAGVNGVINQVEAVVAGSHPSSGDPGPTSAATDTAAAAAVHTDAPVATGANDVVTHAAGADAVGEFADALGHDIG